jgi:hypothetical protein
MQMKNISFHPKLAMEALLKVVSEIPCSALHTLTSMVPNDAK